MSFYSKFIEYMSTNNYLNIKQFYNIIKQEAPLPRRAQRVRRA